MAENEYQFINEKRHQKGKKFFITLGIIFIVVAVIGIACGVPLLIKGIKLQQVSMEDPDWFDKSSQGAGYLFGGVALIAVLGLAPFGTAIGMFATAYHRDIVAYGASATMPIVGDIAKYTANEIAPSFGKVATNVVKPVVSSVSDPIADSVAKAKTKSVGKVCPDCQTENARNAKFCKNCGKSFMKTCPNCGKSLSSQAKFCDDCGTKMQ